MDVDKIKVYGKYKNFIKNIKTHYNLPKYVIENYVRVKTKNRIFFLHQNEFNSLKNNFKKNDIYFRILQSSKFPVSFRFVKENFYKNELCFNKSNYFYLDCNNIMENIIGKKNHFNLKLYINDSDKNAIILPHSNVFAFKSHSVLVYDINNGCYLSRKIDMSNFNIMKNICAVHFMLNFNDLMSTIKTISNKYDVYFSCKENENMKVYNNFEKIKHNLMKN